MKNATHHKKKTIAVTPQQRYGVSELQYVPMGNAALGYYDEKGELKATGYPIVPVINGYIDQGESFEFITVTPDYVYHHQNLKPMMEKVKKLCDEKQIEVFEPVQICSYGEVDPKWQLDGAKQINIAKDPSRKAKTLSRELGQLREPHEGESRCTFISLEIPHSIDMLALLETHRLLLEFLEGHDKLYACLTYGEKPLTSVLNRVLRDAMRIREDVMVDCAVYGQADHSGEGISMIHDHTAFLFDMDAMMETFAMLGETGDDPIALIDEIYSDDVEMWEADDD